MNDLSLIAFGSGMQDGLNPCIFMSCAVFIVHRFWVAPHSWRGDLLSIAFVVAYGLSLFEFNFGAAQFFTFRKEFIFAAKIVYLILGAGTFI